MSSIEQTHSNKMANEVCRVWSKRSNRFLEFRTNPSNTMNCSSTDNQACNHGEVKASGKEGVGKFGKITFRPGKKDFTPHRSFHLVFEEAHPDFYYGLDIDSEDNLSVKCWRKGEDRSNQISLQFQPVQVIGGPDIYLIALKESWKEKSDSLFLASSSDGTLSLRPYHHLDEPHPDELFLKTGQMRSNKMAKVHRMWSLSSQRFLELQINTSKTDLAEVKSSKKKGEGNLGKITFRTGTRSPKTETYHLVFEEATNDRNYSLEIDDDDNLSVKGWKKDTPPNPPLEFQPHSKNSEPFTYLIALKPSWTEKTDKENSLLLASSSDGKLSLRPYHPLDEHHPDELFLLTYV